jgi:sulfane dehydrogenase subunit SoxC
MNSKESDRRRFLKSSAALAGLAMGGVQFAEGQTPADQGERDLHAYGERSHYEKAVRIGNNAYFGAHAKPDAIGYTGPRTPLQDQIGYITPAPLHYFVSHSNEPPDIDPAKHELLIHGMVDRPLVFTLAELKRLPFVSRVHFVECRANGDPSRHQRIDAKTDVQYSHGLTSCSVWTGVPLSILLKEAGIKKEGTWILAEGAEQSKHTKTVPMAKAMDDCLVAYGQNGEAVRPEQGYPLRLLAPGYQGINNVKWLRRIKVVDEPYMTRAETTQYIEQRPDGKARWFESQLGPNSVITYPSGLQQLAGSGFYEIRGIAWSGGGSIRRVEVSTDGGKTWNDAKLQDPMHRKAHTQFSYSWNWNGEESLIRSRSTDDAGEVQPSVAELEKIWKLPADYFNPAPFLFGNFNAVQTWKVNRDGSVENALFS